MARIRISAGESTRPGRRKLAMRSQKRTVKECKSLDVKHIVHSETGEARFGPLAFAGRDGRLGIVTATVRWRRQALSDSSGAFVVSVETTTASNPSPWMQTVFLVPRPCSGRLKIQGRIVPPPAAAGSYDPALRYYYLCPRCRRRCCILYLPRPCGRMWACRK